MDIVSWVRDNYDCATIVEKQGDLMDIVSWVRDNYDCATIEEKHGDLMVYVRANNLAQVCDDIVMNEDETDVPVLQIYTVKVTGSAQNDGSYKRQNAGLSGAVLENSGDYVTVINHVNNDDASVIGQNCELSELSGAVLENSVAVINDVAGEIGQNWELSGLSGAVLENSVAVINHVNDVAGEIGQYAESALENSGGCVAVTNHVNGDNAAEIGNQQKSRKRMRQPELWQRNKSKALRQSGKSYENSKGALVEEKKVQDVDCSKCSRQCASHFTDADRKAIFDGFWSLSDDAKSAFYSKFTERTPKSRKRTQKEVSSRENTILYFLECQGTRHRVCKKFFLATLGISQSRIFYFYSKLTAETTGVPTERAQGRHCKYQVPVSLTDRVRQHIESFPTVESHYARERTARLYLEDRLNTVIMYELYKKDCEEEGVGVVKLHKYRQVFNEEYNISFIKPKTDRCDICEKSKIDEEKGVVLEEEEGNRIRRHKYLKDDAKAERGRDRAAGHADLCFDMENVITLPRANVSNFFYKRKLSVYNLTIHSSLDKIVYCCMWNETESGRGGNTIASALLKGLESFIESHPEVTKITLWSDSCVPQNRNSIMSYALLSFMKKHQHIQEITQKYSESGHSLIQEVDSAHSAIERHLRKCEVYSPVGLIRQLIAVRREPKMKILQLKVSDFLEFEGPKQMAFNKIPYTSVKQLLYKKEMPNFISYKDCHAPEKPMSCVSIVKEKRTPRGNKLCEPVKVKALSSINILKPPTALSKEKVDDLKSMIPYMPALDAVYMQTLVSVPSRTPKKPARSTSM
ncbi:hypothetical protein EGW08_020353 [Elysia chlorotica]|uniref:Uncharacterized protein n=1 Tax=Elysia chlorotica TaxID=188477 RepID=A0A3S1ATS4_ELYCH|nr:hypothetical protein EGW08_020353 [Elysia chlorotica]